MDMIDQEQEIDDAIKVLLKHCNSMNMRVPLSDALNTLVSNEHRTIQQTFIKNINDFLVDYSENGYDGRNESSVLYAKKVKELEWVFPFI